MIHPPVRTNRFSISKPLEETRRIVDRLPDTVHGLMRIAVDDVRLCMMEPRLYDVDVMRWAYRRQGERNDLRCAVCLTGAVMVKSIGIQEAANGTMDLDPSMIQLGLELPYEFVSKMCAIEYARSGMWGQLAQEQGIRKASRDTIRFTPGFSRVVQTPPWDDRETILENLNRMDQRIHKLQELGV